MPMLRFSFIFFDIKLLVANAQSQLSRSDPEAFKAFLLASMVGLRRAEIDQLERTALDWQLEKLHIGVTEHFAVKSQGSIGDVDLDRQLMEVFKNFYEERRGSFVVESRVRPRPGGTYAHYRCQRTFKRLHRLASRSRSGWKMSAPRIAQGIRQSDLRQARHLRRVKGT